MKKSLLSKMIAVLLCVILAFSSSIVAYANYVTGSLIGNSISSSKWMSTIEDDTKLSDMSLPGTHDSGTKWIGTSVAGAWTTTQDLTIPQQLEAGVRYLDIRLAYDSTKAGSAKVMHSSIECLNENNTNMTFEDVCRYLKDFLTTNPTETVVVSVKQDAGDAASSLAQALQETISEYSSYWYTGTSTPTLGQVRGKAVIAPRMREFSGGIHMDWSDQGSDGSAVSYTWYKVQDRYSMGVDSKWSSAAKPMMDETKTNGVWYVNFLSTTGGGISGVSANSGTMNSYFSQYETTNNKCYGIVVFDYVSENLAKKVYKCNDLVSKNKPDNSKGQYYYRINLNTTQSVADGWSSVWLKLYYKENNGTGSEKSVLLFENGDEYNGYQFVCNVGNFDFSGAIDGFPTKVEFRYDWGYGAKTLSQNLNLYVSSSPSGSMTKCVTNNFVGSSSASTPYKGTETYNVSSTLYPRASTIAFDSSSSSVGVPNWNSDSKNKYTHNASVYDQYGVKWYKEPTSYSLDSIYEGVSLVGNAIYTDKTANNNTHNQKMTIEAQFNNNSVVLRTTKTLTLNTNTIDYQFVNSDGTVLQSGSEYAGTVPSYTGDTPTTDATSSAHYIFKGWDNSNPISLDNQTYTAKYIQSQHNISKVEHTLLPTCTENGYDTYYCSCGYSWTVDINATGHTLITTNLEPTCTQDGYHRIHCSKCDYIQLEEIKPALGHDYENAILGEYISATDKQNGYQTYICPRDNVELEKLRVYDSNDWSGYNEALKGVEDIKNDSQYSTYDSAAVAEFEAAISNARLIEDYDERLVLQVDIDNSTNQILSAIDTFGNAIGATYYEIIFLKNDGTVISTRYKSGTSAKDIAKPENTPYLITDTQHTVYKWGNILDVTSSATYKEYSVTSNHSFNTFIFPDEESKATCQNDGIVTHTCLCGYSYTEVTTTALGHNYSNWVSNGDGTHTKVCQNDSSHTETELCDLSNNYKCIDCGYSLDVSAYASLVIEVAPKLGDTNIYTPASIENLRQTLIQASESITSARTQADIDRLVSNIQTANNNLTRMPYSVLVQYSYTDSDEYTITTPSEYYCEAGEKTFAIPDEVQGNVYKWMVESQLSSQPTYTSSKEFTISIDSSIVVTCYLSQSEETTQSTSKLCFIGKSGRVASTKYVSNSDYDLDITNSVITIGSESVSMAIPFYKVSHIVIDGESYYSGDLITINQDSTISVVYTAK